jgi:hypothetical protein
LPGARRPVQQQPALEVLPGRGQARAVRGDTEGVPLDPGQHRLGQDDISATKPWRVEKGELDIARRTSPRNGTPKRPDSG